MPFAHGSKAKFRLDNAAGTLTDISMYVTSVGLSNELDTADVSVMGNTAKQFVVGLSGGSISLEGKFDPVIHTQLTAIVANNGTITGGNTLEFQYDPQGTGAGLPRFAGASGTSTGCFLTNYEVSTDVGDGGTWSATLQITGAVTVTAQ